jgi:DNA-binding beta-propeller fold protein YncE
MGVEMPKREILIVLMMMFLFGCAKQPVQKELLAWPSLPTMPRIAYVNSYRGSIDFIEPNFFDIIFGASQTVKNDIYKPFAVSAYGDKIYVSDTGFSYVAVIDTKERKVSFLGTGGRAILKQPFGVAAAADGTIYVADGKLKSIYAFDQNGELLAAFGNAGELVRPAGIAVNSGLGRLYVCDVAANAVFAYSLKGERLFEFKKGDEPGAGYFNSPTHLAIDRRNGNVFVADTNNFRVQVFDKDGTYLRKFGQLGDNPGDFSRPKGIAVDSEGHVYVADAAFNNFQIFDDMGQLLLAIGTLGQGAGQFQLPGGMYVDDQDRIYVADTVNKRVEVFQFMGDAWKQAHPEEFNKYLLPGPAVK